MPHFSDKSKFLLSECHPKLIEIFNEVIKDFDCTILCGFRCEHEQKLAFEKGNSKVNWPNSKHNKMPATAVDVAPYPIDWNNLEAFKNLAKKVLAIAAVKGYHIRWGGDFNMNGIADDKFIDMPHFELIEK